MPPAGVIADANVLLSAVMGKAARRVFTSPGLAVHSTLFNAGEVERYFPTLAEKFHLPLALMELEWKLLPLRLHPLETYREHLDWALSLLIHRDADDAHPLALARTLGLPIWSNDRDLQGLEVECLPTARLLASLEREGKLRE
ncbi:MAG TPA: PIN domain-containing protein [Thermoanaerobaculia bacterium]|nr:PIN domain-containing protein [Thermoanaerobaculia bacterium]